jgi:hypothetical protein
MIVECSVCGLPSWADDHGPPFTHWICARCQPIDYRLTPREAAEVELNRVIDVIAAKHRGHLSDDDEEYDQY